jgi:hypothetical protein
MKRKYTIGVLLLVAAVIAYWGYREYNRTRADSKKLEAKFRTDANSLLQEFISNEAAATVKYAGQDIIISVTGTLKNIERTEAGHFTFLLGDTASLSSIRCLMDTSYNKEWELFKKGDQLLVKGNFNGYKPDELGIGADVEMNFCVVDSPSIQQKN